MKYSAGLLIYRQRNHEIEVFLVHPGGPYWAGKDEGAWSIPKGEFIPGKEDGLKAAIRETEEETGCSIVGSFRELPSVRLKSGKTIKAWMVQSELDTEGIHSNTFEIEWPPHSGETRSFPEIDRAEWFNLKVAYAKISSGQTLLLDQLKTIIKDESHLL